MLRSVVTGASSASPSHSHSANLFRPNHLKFGLFPLHSFHSIHSFSSSYLFFSPVQFPFHPTLLSISIQSYYFLIPNGVMWGNYGFETSSKVEKIGEKERMLYVEMGTTVWRGRDESQ
jgi:hypothetical protein